MTKQTDLKPVDRLAEHHDVIVVGGGPGGLGLAPLLGGLYPYYRDSTLYATRFPEWAERLRRLDDTLYQLDFQAIAAQGIKPVDFFRSLHHPSSHFGGPDELALQFRTGPGLDFLLLSREEVGGVWNSVPDNLLALSPGHWMEFAYYPLWQFAAETGRRIDPNALIHRDDLIAYYHAIPERFGVRDRVQVGVEVEEIYGEPERFEVIARDVATGERRSYTSRFLVYAAGQRALLRRLGVPGDDLPCVTQLYRRPADFPGERVVVVGGGRSADWAATELYDAGKTVDYVMRQGFDVHWRLIDDSRGDLPYYARLADIIQSGDPRLRRLYHTRVERIEPTGDGATVTLSRCDRGVAGATDGAGTTLDRPPSAGERLTIHADHVVAEIGGTPNYGVLRTRPPLRLVPLRDRYRFQCHQILTHDHSYESQDVAGLYAGGYLAVGTSPSVLSMHGTVYATAADLFKRAGLV